MAFDISDLLGGPDVFPYPAWKEVATRIELLTPGVRRAAWADATRQWLMAICDWTGESFAVRESENVQLLAWANEEYGNLLLRHVEYCRQSLLDLFPEIARFTEPGKHVVLAFPDQRIYYDYVSAFHPEEGEFGGSAVMYIRAGYAQIVACGPQLSIVQSILAHELTHAALHHLGSPQWVEEGVAQIVEEAAAGRAPLEVTPEVARWHKRYWTRHGLGPFWWGTGFHRPGRVQQLSYQLAEILMRLLIDEHRPGWLGIGKGKRDRLVEFLKAAREGDAGQVAAGEHLRYTLGAVAAKFLGPGEWEPNSSDIAVVPDLTEDEGFDDGAKV